MGMNQATEATQGAAAVVTVIGGASFTNTKSIDLDGTDDRITVADHTSLDITGDLTIALWIQMHSLGGWKQIFTKGGNGSFEQNVYSLSLYNNTIRFFRDDDDSSGLTASGTLNANTWYHIAVVFDDSEDNVKIYVNAVEKASSDDFNSTTSANSSVLTIGGDADGDYEIDGYMDEVAIWNDALSASEISSVYNSRVPRSLASDYGNYSSSSNLQGYWRFEDTLDDSSGNSRDGTAVGDPGYSSSVPAEWSNTKSLDFDGTDDYIGFSLSHDFSSGAFSVSCWAKFDDAVNSAQQACVSKTSTVGNSAFLLGVNASGEPRWYHRHSGGTDTEAVSSDALSDDTWYHLVGTMDSSNTAKIYVNGVLKATTTSSSRSNNGNLRIGEAGDSYWNSIEGLLDEVTIWSSELSLANVQTLYNSGTPVDPADQSISGLISYFKLNDSNVDEEGMASSITTSSSPSFSSTVPPN